MGRSRQEIFELGARADTSGLDKIDKSLKKLTDGFDALADSQDDVGDSSERASGGLASWADATLVAGGALAGLNVAMGAVSGVFNASVGEMFSQEQAMRGVAAATGLTGDALADFETQAEDVFLNNWGDDFQDVADAMTVVKRITGESGDALEGLTTNALIMRDTFDADVTESVRTANTMMDQFGISGDEAFDLLAYGMQQTGDPADDLLDTFNEYSGNFADMGLTGDQALRLIQSGLAGGARNADDIADATREFNIKMQEGLDGTEEWRKAFLALGPDAEGVLTDLEGGYADGADALQFTLDKLREIEDPIERNRLGVELFGTKWEDMGSQAFDSMSIAGGAIDDVEGSMQSAGDELSNGIGPAFENLKRVASQALVSGLEPLAPVIEDALIPAMQDVSGWITDSGVPAMQDFGTSVAPVITNLWAFGTSLFGATLGSESFADFMTTAGKAMVFASEKLAGLDIAGGLAAWGEMPEQLGVIGSAITGMLSLPEDFSFSTWISDNIIIPLSTAMLDAVMFLTPFDLGIDLFGEVLTGGLLSSLPEWGEWVMINIITPIGDALAGLYVAVGTAINNAIPDNFEIEMSIPRPPLPGVPAWIKDGIPNPLFEGSIGVPLPANPIPVGDVGNNAAGGSYMVPGGGDSDLPFIMGGVQPGEGINIIPRSAMAAGGGNSGGDRVMQPVIVQAGGKQIYSAMLEIDSQSNMPRLRRS